MQRVIVSVYYKELRAVRPYRLVGTEDDVGFSTTFRLPAAEKGGYTTCVVPNLEERFQAEFKARQTPLYKDTTGDKVAACLLNEWCGDTAFSAFGNIGVFICQDNDQRDQNGKIIQPATEPSERELKEARAALNRYCERVILEAVDLDRTGKRSMIQRHHVECAEYRGRTYSWMEQGETATTEQCPLCRVEIAAGCVVCPNCKNTINARAFAEFQRAEQEVTDGIARLAAEAVAMNPDLAGSEALDIATSSASMVAPRLPGRK